MKYRILRGFLAVYLAVSLAYGGIRAAYLTVSAALNPPVVPETAAVLSESFGTEETVYKPKEETAAVSASEGRAASASDDPPPSETPAETQNAAPSVTDAADEAAEAILAPPVQEPTEEAPVDEAEEPTAAGPQETMAEPEEAEDDEDAYWEEASDEPEEESWYEPEPVEYVPTLEEYLSGLHCGRCGRNCLLSSPRCRTGRSKAESAEAAYYEEYA